MKFFSAQRIHRHVCKAPPEEFNGDGQPFQQNQSSMGLSHSNAGLPSNQGISSNHEIRELLWRGTVEWQGIYEGGPTQTLSVPCSVSRGDYSGVTELVPDKWPLRLRMKFVPVSSLRPFAIPFLERVKPLAFNFSECQSLLYLTAAMKTGLAGFIQFSNSGGLKVLILGYNMKTFLAWVPNNQNDFMAKLVGVFNQVTLGQLGIQVNYYLSSDVFTTQKDHPPIHP